jgi:hypothetical protein
LGFILALLLLQILIAPHLSIADGLGGFFGFVVPLMLLFNHLAYQFRWSRPVTIVWRVIAWLWLAFGLLFILFRTVVLFAG